MQNRKPRNFELKLNKVGVVLFTFGVSCLVLIAFVLGVMVGKNIETYPEKITGAIPGLIREKIASTPVAPGVVAKPEDVKEAMKDEKDVKLTFYDSLAAKKEVKENLSKGDVQERSGVVEKPVPKEKPAVKETYVLRVASFKDEGKAIELQKRLSAMGYQATVETRELNSGKFYRVNVVGFEAREEAEKAAEAVKSKTKAKCVISKQSSP